MKIEFDLEKGQTNIRKHGVSFEEAKTALYDPFAWVMEDDESIYETRFLLLGKSENSRILLVVYAYRQDEVIRIISARKATTKEKTQYESGI